MLTEADIIGHSASNLFSLALEMQRQMQSQTFVLLLYKKQVPESCASYRTFIIFETQTAAR